MYRTEMEIASKVKYEDREGNVLVKTFAEGSQHASVWVQQAMQEGQIERIVARGDNGVMWRDWESQLPENQLYTIAEKYGR